MARLNAILEGMGVNEREALRSEVARLNTELPALRQEQLTLLASVGPLRTEVAALTDERGELAQVRTETASLRTQRDALLAEVAQLHDMIASIQTLRAELDELQGNVIETRDIALLQEVGVYQYRHPLDDSPAYKAKLTDLQLQIKDAVKAGTAVVGSTSWSVNGSPREGARMIKEFSKLMLRAYNNEADSAIRSMKPYALNSARARLTKAKDTISKLGKTMNITVTHSYHQLRLTELEYTADYLAKVAVEKERDRAERARKREEETAQRELEREKERLRKEQAHYAEAAASLRAQGDLTKAAEAEEKVEDLQGSIAGVEYRQANIRTGNVYVISNIGSFGPDVVKVGMTRRLDPMERIRELGDASVPFHYDVHAIVFSKDAVGLENYLHRQLAEHRVNLVNTRREFFRVSPARVREILLASDEAIVTWHADPEASEWHLSENTRRSQQQATLPEEDPVAAAGVVQT